MKRKYIIILVSILLAEGFVFSKYWPGKGLELAARNNNTIQTGKAATCPVEFSVPGGKPEDLDGALNAWSSLIENADNIPIIYGGDYNSASHLDDGIGKSGHSKLMEAAGFIDSFRSKYPDVATYPGLSAPDYRDRIDYIYYKS